MAINTELECMVMNINLVHDGELVRGEKFSNKRLRYSRVVVIDVKK